METPHRRRRNRFKKQKAMNAYLGVCPRVKSSGGKTNNGHINRESRKLSRTIFTQSVYHISMSSMTLRKFYTELIKYPNLHGILAE